MSAKKYLDHTGLQYYDNKLKTYVANSYLPLTGGVVMPTNPFGGKRLYINSIDNAFANADKKFYVTITKHKKTEGGVTYPYVDTSKARTDDNYYVDGPVVATLTSSASLLFNGDYENSIDLESNGTTYLKVRIMFGSNSSPSASTSYFSGYPYGNWYLSYYYTYTPNIDSQVRVYNKYTEHTIGWHLYTSTFYNGSPSSANVIQKIEDWGDYSRTCVDFIIYGNDTSGRPVSLTQIEYQLVRPSLSRDGSTVTKYGPQNLYSDFSWYSGHTLNAKVSADGYIYGYEFYENGTSLSNKYLQKSGGTISNGSNSDPLAIKGLGDTYLRFENSSGTILGYLGVNSSKQPVFYDTSSHRLALYSELPSVSNATITIKQSGISDQTFTLNGSATTITLKDTTYSIVDDMDPGLAPKLPAGDPQVGTNVLTSSGGTPQWVTGVLTDTTYESKTAASGGTDVSLVTTGEKYTWNNKVDTSPFLEAFIASSAAIMGNQMLVIDSEGAFSWEDNHPSAASGGTALSLVTTGEKYNWNNKGTYSKPNGGIPDSDLASTFVKVASQTLTDAQKTQARTNIGAGTSSLAIGTTATTAAAGNHTHTTSIEIGGSGTSFDLSYGTKYTLYAGGNSFVFKTPALGTTSTTAAAGDHTHSQYLTTAVTKLGARTGDITLANLKSDLGLGSAAYTDSTDFSLVGHTHSYAGSSSVGGAATSANKINTDAGSATQPVYFSSGVPVATTYSLGKSVPSNAVFTDTATAADNILDGSNSGTQITYAPYSSSTATAQWVATAANYGKFYLGTQTPYVNANTRLNYNGDIYARNFNSSYLITTHDIKPAGNVSYSVGSSDYRYKNIYTSSCYTNSIAYNESNTGVVWAYNLCALNFNASKDITILVDPQQSHAEQILNIEYEYDQDRYNRCYFELDEGYLANTNNNNYIKIPYKTGTLALTSDIPTIPPIPTVPSYYEILEHITTNTLIETTIHTYSVQYQSNQHRSRLYNLQTTTSNFLDSVFEFLYENKDKIINSQVDLQFFDDNEGLTYDIETDNLTLYKNIDDFSGFMFSFMLYGEESKFIYDYDLNEIYITNFDLHDTSVYLIENLDITFNHFIIAPEDIYTTYYDDKSATLYSTNLQNEDLIINCMFIKADSHFDVAVVGLNATNLFNETTVCSHVSDAINYEFIEDMYSETPIANTFMLLVGAYYLRDGTYYNDTSNWFITGTTTAEGFLEFYTDECYNSTQQTMMLYNNGISHINNVLSGNNSIILICANSQLHYDEVATILGGKYIYEYIETEYFDEPDIYTDEMIRDLKSKGLSVFFLHFNPSDNTWSITKLHELV